MIDDSLSDSLGPSLTQDMLISRLLSVSRYIMLETLMGMAVHSAHHRFQDIHKRINRWLNDPQVRSNRLLFELLVELARELKESESDIKGVLRFFRYAENEDSLPCDAHAEIGRAARLWMEYLHQRKCKLELRFGAYDAGAKITREHLQEIVAALLVNSVEAHSTSILITTENKKGWRVSDIFKLKNGLDIRVEDNGDGFAGDQSEAMFEPRYTTKARSGGVGLGLFIARSLARRAGGELLYVGPSNKRGAIFSIALSVQGA